MACGYLRKSLNLGELLRKGVAATEFSLTAFEIYDRSTEKICDRLIIVRPFDWYILALNNELLILNPEVFTSICPRDSASAIRIDGNERYTEICLNARSNESVVSSYTNSSRHFHISFDIAGNKFTVLSAINMLLDMKYVFYGGTDDNSKPRLIRSADEIIERHGGEKVRYRDFYTNGYEPTVRNNGRFSYTQLQDLLIKHRPRTFI